jgi:hypothetical protein
MLCVVVGILLLITTTLKIPSIKKKGEIPWSGNFGLERSRTGKIASAGQLASALQSQHLLPPFMVVIY